MPVRQYYQHQQVQGVKVGRFNQGINTQFIVYRMGSTVIDAGPSNQWRHVKEYLNKEPVTQLLLTHHHEDHSGNAQRIAKTFSITPKAPKLAQAKLANGYPTPLLQKIVWGSPKPVHTEHLADVESLSDGTQIIPVHTPGHAKDLTCFHVPSEGYFFSGDLYIAKTIKMLRQDEDLKELINSLKKVQKLDFDTLFCPHGGIIREGKQALNLKLNNILQLCTQVKELAEKGWSFQQIGQYLLGPEDATAKLTKGNFSKYNLIKQCALINL
jgi:glyoxylase-like metal-dependent hydrolase (beta-lactamase superfamily II)